MPIPETEIIVSKDGTELLRKTVRPGDYVIGREPECEVRVEVEGVAPRHAQLTVNFDHVLINDLGSETATFVNGQRVKECTRLWPNQKIQIGAATVELHRIKTGPAPDVTLAPGTAAVKRLLPEEFLREKKYDIGGVVAQGGMGAILAAQQSAMQRGVAMKVMLHSAGEADVLRFIEEAQVTGQLAHPNIVPVYELGVDEADQLYYTMKMVHGITLKRVLELLEHGSAETVKDYPLPVLLTIFQKLCDAVAFAHSKGVIHRDLKPENIMLGDFGEALVMDWGLAKVLGGTRSGASPTSNAEGGRAGARPSDTEHGRAGARPSDGTASATLAGTILGTPQYMAPEQARGEVEALDERSDIYALGAILYHILTLRPPFEGYGADDILAKVRSGEFTPPIHRVYRLKKCPPTPPADADNTPTILYTTPPPAAETSARHSSPRVASMVLPHLPDGTVPASLNAVATKAMAMEKSDRYQNVADLQRDIAAYQNGFATQAEHASLIKQILLLIRRHKGVFATGFAAWLIITTLVIWFIINLRAREHETRRQAAIAGVNEWRAEANERKALAEKESARRALAKARISLGEAAYREQNATAMQVALNGVPGDLRDTNWHYLIQHADMSARALGRPESAAISGVAADPTRAGVFAVASANGKITFIEARSGKPVSEFPFDLSNRRASSAYPIAISPDGKRVAIGDDGGKGIAIYKADDGKKIVEWKAPITERLEFSPDGQFLLQTSKNALEMWQSDSGKLLWEDATSATARNIQARFLPGGVEILAFASQVKLHLIKAKDGTETNALSEWRSPSTIVALAVGFDGKMAVAGDTQGWVHGLDLKDGRLLFENRVQSAPIDHLAFVEGGARFVSAASHPDGRQSIEIWDTASGQPMRALLGGSGALPAMGVDPVSGDMVTGGPNARVWNLGFTPEKWLFPYSSSALRYAHFWTSDNLLFGPIKGNYLALKDLSEDAVLWKPSDNATRTISMSADGRFAAIGYKNSSRVQILQVGSEGKPVECAAFEQARAGIAISRERLSPNGDRLAALGPLTSFILDSTSGKRLATLEITGLVHLSDLVWSRDGTRLIGLATASAPRGVSGSEEQIVVWDTATGKKLQSAPHPAPLDCAAISPDGRSFAEAGADKMIRIRDIATLEVRLEFRAHDGPVTALAWNPARPVIASASEDLTVKLWNAETGSLLEELHEPLTAPQVLNFSPSGKRLACAGPDHATRIWEPVSLK